MKIEFPSLIGYCSKIVAYHVDLAILCKSVNAGLFISQLLYWTKQESCKDGWIYRTQEQLYEETGMTRRNQENARKVLKDLNILEERQKGIPKKLYYKINQKCLNDLILGYTDNNVQNVHSSVYETNMQERAMCTDSSVQNVQTINNTIEDYNKINKESVEETHTQVRKPLNEIQQSVGNKSVDPSETSLMANVKNKYTDLDVNNKDSLNKLYYDLRDYIWRGLFDKHKDEKFPARFGAIEIQIEKFIQNMITRDHFSNQFYEVERQLELWLKEKINKWTYWPNHEWNITKEESKKKQDPKNGNMPDYFSISYRDKCTPEQWKAYRKHLKDLDFYQKQLENGSWAWYDKYNQRVDKD